MFNEVKNLLEAGKIDEEVAKALDEEIAKALKERNDENAKLRIENKELKTTLQGEREALKKEYEAKIEEAKKEGKVELEKEFATKLQEVETRAKELEQKTREANLKAQLTTTLSKYDVVDLDVASSYIKNYITEKDDDFGIKLGDEVLNFENGVEKILNEKSFLLKAKGNTGSGANNPQDTGVADDTFTARLLQRKKQQ